jgi:hypothetical protein
MQNVGEAQDTPVRLPSAPGSGTDSGVHVPPAKTTEASVFVPIAPPPTVTQDVGVLQETPEGLRSCSV